MRRCLSAGTDNRCIRGLLVPNSATNQPYHKWYADKVLVLAMGADIHTSDSLISTGWQKLPYMLKRIVDKDTEDWEKFAKAIKDVSWGKLKVEAGHKLDSRKSSSRHHPRNSSNKTSQYHGSNST